MNIVVLSYGPSQTTKQAVRRARRLVGNGESVRVVPATRLTAEPDQPFGGPALLDAIDELTADTLTLLIHDDVVITTRGVVALERALNQGATLAIPFTNDPNTDHFIGALPVGKAAVKTLDTLAPPQDSRNAGSIRPSCVAGSSAALRELLNEPIVDPYVTVGNVGPVTIVGGAVASHETLCLHELLTEDDIADPLLVAALIVKDEEELLPDCLASLSTVCDRIEVCDTGSSDATVAIATEAGAAVSHREWDNDFGRARTFVLDRCRDAQYVVVIDADERLLCSNPESTRRYLATYALEHPAFRIQVANVNETGAETYSFDSVRLFHGADTEYRGALHELPFRIGDPDPLKGHGLGQMSVTHFGYSTDIVADRAKADRNLELAEAQYAERADAVSAVHLARSLNFKGQDPERALQLLEAGLEEARDGSAATQAQILTLMADTCSKLGQDSRAFELAVDALRLVPDDDGALGVLAHAYTSLGNHEEFLQTAEAITSSTNGRIMTIAGNRLLYRDRVVAAYAKTQQAEKAVASALELLGDDPAGLECWPDLIDCLNTHYGGASIELLVPLTLADASGGFLEPIIKTYPSGTVAAFCAEYVSKGGAIPDATRVGLLAAAMSSNDDAFATIAPSADHLDPVVRVGLAERIASSGRPDLAATLRNEPIAG